MTVILLLSDIPEVCGKKSEFDLFKTQKRSGMGMIGYKVTEKTGKIAGITSIREDEDLMLIASNGVIIRMFSAEINSLGRATQGVTLMRSDDGATVIGIAKTPHEEEKEEAAEENAEAPAEEVTE